jgi:hypothetical protein
MGSSLNTRKKKPNKVNYCYKCRLLQFGLQVDLIVTAYFTNGFTEQYIVKYEVTWTPVSSIYMAGKTWVLNLKCSGLILAASACSIAK